MLFALHRVFQDIRDYRHKAARFHPTGCPPDRWDAGNSRSKDIAKNDRFKVSIITRLDRAIQ